MNKELEEWNDILSVLIPKSKSVAIGIYSTKEKLLYANSAMCYFLDTNSNELLPKNALINPDIKTLIGSEKEPVLFEGLLTIGNYVDIHFVLNAKIYKRKNRILIFGEVNVAEMFNENSKMSKLNQEVNNLQRQLIKEKSNLQSTLKELKETQQMLIHSEKMNALGKLVAGVAHELNNPISFTFNNIFSLENYTKEIIGAYKQIENLVKNTSDAGLQNSIHRIHSENDLDYLVEDLPCIIDESKLGLERVKLIVEDLRKFSRLDEAEIKNIDLIQNIHSTLSILKSEMNNKNIDFRISGPEKLYIDCYPGQLNQAIFNIILNAIQAVNENGILQVDIEEDNTKVSISVKDNGCGIDESIMHRIFDPFYTTKDIGKGMGLGLSISYKIIYDLHGGSINVESKPDVGSVFIISIPKQIEL